MACLNCGTGNCVCGNCDNREDRIGIDKIIRKYLNKKITIGVDFDGTICEHTYPNIGEPITGAIGVLKDILKNNHNLILWTVRGGKELKAAVDYCRSNGIEFWGINENPDQTKNYDPKWEERYGEPYPDTATWSCKAHMNILIDDVALGCPLKNGSVDWGVVRENLEERGVI